ncbi:hypothetical protein EDB19DRAFT_1717710, partial [Suillus lakei]
MSGSRSGKRTLRTGFLRPGNGVFGPGGGLIWGAFLVHKYNLPEFLISCNPSCTWKTAPWPTSAMKHVSSKLQE